MAMISESRCLLEVYRMIDESNDAFDGMQASQAHLTSQAFGDRDLNSQHAGNLLEENISFGVGVSVYPRQAQARAGNMQDSSLKLQPQCFPNTMNLYDNPSTHLSLPVHGILGLAASLVNHNGWGLHQDHDYVGTSKSQLELSQETSYPIINLRHKDTAEESVFKAPRAPSTTDKGAITSDPHQSMSSWG
ncbi:uncharacterized protein MELLADRAFT_66652 [Melampsora larici-populina 98AG31]|uniref:Uncharacterized protein n=1 Tax=Melampsora larici-populina (strain 98AG31 / pathotype 3-4-7) TaxID=747676 RepID=F4S039_MELLP|nr:uncharacterized protein MELLADRAFT_66652 [Melampsora larici-populina 98AG31]EGG02007.1 hypothetical protein MELLADRAFT_66652 [Melampsora larici-populina 98AG31]